MSSEQNQGPKEGNQQVTKYELQEKYRTITERVATCYRSCKDSQPLGAAQWDPAKVRNGKTALAIHFCIDVEHAVERALRARPDRAELIRRFVQLSHGGTFGTIGKLESVLIFRCGPAFRLINPSNYFIGRARPAHRELGGIVESYLEREAVAA